LNHKLLEVTKTQREKTYQHTAGMLSVLEEFEQGSRGERTEALGAEWDKAKTIYDTLTQEQKLLLYLGVPCHDIYKPFASRDHAEKGYQLLKASRESFVDGRLDIAEAILGKGATLTGELFDDLLFLVRHHEFLGNFFTGEQTLSGAKPILKKFKKRLADLPGFLNVLRLLTVAEVGSYDKSGYLSAWKFRRYAEAIDGVLRMAPKTEYNEVATEKETCQRILGLVYAFADPDKLDTLHDAYESSVKMALEKAGVNDGFPQRFDRLAKLSYGLQWLQILSGGKNFEGRVKDADELVLLIKGLDKLASMGKKVKSRVEIVFKDDVTPKEAGDAEQALRDADGEFQIKRQGKRLVVKNASGSQVLSMALAVR